MHLIQADNLSIGWASAARLLAREDNHETWDLAVEIADPLCEVPEIRQGLDDHLTKTTKQSVQTVANTIFPQQLWKSCSSREDFYNRYRNIVSKLRRFSKNRHGLYFERLTRWPPGGQEYFNQLEAVIDRLARQLTLPGPRRFVYDLLTFSPVDDPLPTGFPCLSYVNVKLQGRSLTLLAHYRNHFFVERAYGNYLGLAQLQSFIADAVGIRTGPLVCVSGHAELDDHRRPFLQWLQQIQIDQT